LPCSSLARVITSALCAAALVVPTQVRAMEPDASAPPPTTTPPEDERPSEIGDASADEMHDAMMRAFVERFQEGKFLYNRGQYVQAAAEFERAFAAIPAEAALRNVVLSYERAQDRVSAALAARRYLALPSCDTPDLDPALCSQHRDDIEKQLERLMEQIGELQLKVEKGVTLREVFVNNRKVAIADFPVLITPGRIDVELVGALPGERRQRFVDVKQGESQTIIVGPFDVPDPDPGGQIGPRRRLERPKWLKPLFWSGFGITLASGAAMATMGGLTLKAKHDFEDRNHQGATSFPEDFKRQKERYQLATNVLVGVTAGLAMITTIVGLVAFTGPDNRHKRNRGTQRASTRMRWTGAGVLVRW
jgi:hypothetical protein